MVERQRIDVFDREESIFSTSILVYVFITIRIKIEFSSISKRFAIADDELSTSESFSQQSLTFKLSKNNWLLIQIPLEKIVPGWKSSIRVCKDSFEKKNEDRLSTAWAMSKKSFA